MADFPEDLIIPQDGVIRKHIELYRPPNEEPKTEAPIQFIYSSILATLGTIIQKSAWMPWFGDPLYCNLFTLLIGESTTTKKTSCIRACQRYLIDMCTADPRISTFLFPSTGSPEGMFELLSQRSKGIFVFSEFSTLTDLLEKKYASDLKGFLTDLFDSGLPLEKKLSNKKIITISDHCINLYAGTAIDWFEQASKSKDFTSGWYTRFLFVWGEDSGLCIPWPTSKNNQLRMRIIQDLVNIYHFSPGMMTIDPIAKETHDAWYKKKKKRVSVETKTMDVRLFDYAVKISMINAISRMKSEVTLSDMNYSTNFIDWLMENNKRLVSEYISFSQWDSEIKKIKNLLRKYGGLTRRDLMRKTGLVSKQMDVCFMALREREEIMETKTRPSSKGGRPTIIIELK